MIKKLFALCTLSLILLSFATKGDGSITIFMIGDSTMANKPIDKENQERGWGQALSNHLQGNIIVDNHAVNGRSTKSFIDEGRWDVVLSKIKPGDYVFIQFGHNDEKADEKRHTDPNTTFKANLTRFIREAREKGANPVLFNSIVRRNFVDGVLTDTHGEYVTVTEMIAKKENVPYIDANWITYNIVNKLGVDHSRKLFMNIEPGKYEFCPNGKTDNTHLNIYGANLISHALINKVGFVVPELSKYIKSDPLRFPCSDATGICPDTHLNLKFNSPVKVGKRGWIRVYDETIGEMVDSIDMSIPAGPTESRTYSSDCDYTKIPYDYKRSFICDKCASPTWGKLLTNRNTVAGTPSGTAEPNSTEYQLNIIGGFSDAFHYYPIIATNNEVDIILHNNVLEYGHKYSISIDKEVIESSDFNGIKDWTFTVRKQGPNDTTYNIDRYGQGDFCTVQGALDMIPDFSDIPYIINISDDEYEEIVYARNKSNVTIQGAGIDKTIVHYANNEVFNPHPLRVKTNELRGTFPTRRAAFAIDNCHDVILRDLTIATDCKGQAEGLFLMGEHFNLFNVHIIGDGDALQANGTIYMENCSIDGGADTFLSRGAIYAYKCKFRNNGGPFAWPRSTKQNHGLVFVECDFSTNNGSPVDFGRCPENHGKRYPETEMVLINCTAKNVIPSGWSAIGEKKATFLEYNTCNSETLIPLPTDKRHKYSRQLNTNKKKDAKLIKNYSTPEFVLDGWKPTKQKDKEAKEQEDMSKLSDL